MSTTSRLIRVGLFALLALTRIALAAGNAAAPPGSLGEGHRFACADYSQGRVVVVAVDGKIEWEYPAPGCNDLWMLPNGEQVVREYDQDGKTVATLPAAGGPHSVARLPNGHTLISCGDLAGGSRIFEVDKFGKRVWQIQDGDLPGVSLKFLAGFQRLPNGNTVFANWLGHGQFGKAPHLLEVTPDKRVLWTFSDHQNLKTISSVQLLDLTADPAGGEICH